MEAYTHVHVVVLWSWWCTYIYTQEERSVILHGSQAKVHVFTTENLLLFHVEFREFTYIPCIYMCILPQTSLIINNARRQNSTTIANHVTIILFNFCIIRGEIADFRGVRLVPCTIADLFYRALYMYIVYSTVQCR